MDESELHEQLVVVALVFVFLVPGAWTRAKRQEASSYQQQNGFVIAAGLDESEVAGQVNQKRIRRINASQRMKPSATL